MRYGRSFSLPIDPWPQASLAERTAVGMVLTFLLLLPACAAGAVLFVASTLAAHVYWSYDLGASVRSFVASVIARRTGGTAGQRVHTVRKV